MPSPLEVPRRPAWRYKPVTTYGRVMIPAAITAEDREIIGARRDSTNYREDKETTNERSKRTD